MPASVPAGLAGNGSPGADAFSALVQALAEISGQSTDPNAASGDGGQNAGQGQTTAQPSSTTPSPSGDGTGGARAADPIVIAAATDPSTESPLANDGSGETGSAAADRTHRAESDADTPVDPTALALLAGTAQAGTTPASDAASATDGATAAGSGSQTTASLATDASQTAQAQAGQPTGDAGPASSTDGSEVAATGIQMPAAVPAGLGALLRPKAGSGAASKTSKDGEPKPAADTRLMGPAASTGLGPRAVQGLGRPATGGLPPAQPHGADDSKDSGSASDDGTGGRAESSAPSAQPDQQSAQPPTPTVAATVVPAAATPVVAAQGLPTAGASAPQAASNPALPDPQTLMLTARSAALASSAVAQVNVLLQRAGLSRAESLTVQLDPAELGRVEVKLKIDKNGPVHAQVTADRPQTLEMLRNDKAQLQRALQSAGLSTDMGSLSFNLRDNGNSGQGAGTGNPGRGGTRIAPADEGKSIAAQLAVTAAPSGWTGAGRLDLRV